jgi:hypothetical protein
MIRLIAIVAFALGIVFYAWSLGHGAFQWPLFALIGFLCLAIDGPWNWKWPHS